jgi:predicted XRE-type DNA-binding protein
MNSAKRISEEAELKLALASRVNEIIAMQGLSQSEAALKIGTTQPKVSQIRRYQLRNISVGRLLQALVALEQRIDILIQSTDRSNSASITVAA